LLVVPQLDSYFEVHLLLKLLDARNPGSAETVKAVILMLDNENSVIARRAYTFLEKQKLTGDQAQVVEEFRKRNAERL